MFTFEEKLNEETVDLVNSFSTAMKEKLLKSQQKYGWANDWKDSSIDGLRRELDEHIRKGDPRDVAAYCMFLWYHKATTS